MSLESDSAVAPAVEAPIAPAPEPAPSPVGPLVDAPHIRDVAKPDRIDPEPVLNLDRPLNQQKADHEVLLRQQDELSQAPRPLSSVAMPRSWANEQLCCSFRRIAAAMQHYREA
jgi:hypothetical protein